MSEGMKLINPCQRAEKWSTTPIGSSSGPGHAGMAVLTSDLRRVQDGGGSYGSAGRWWLLQRNRTKLAVVHPNFGGAGGGRALLPIDGCVQGVEEGVEGGCVGAMSEGLPSELNKGIAASCSATRRTRHQAAVSPVHVYVYV